ncbi:tripartite motif-containing protein 45-like isoform X2 [Limulus polyphemus]|uniref:Tripartite motif-containing protein 45-like isoform X2 n=1 Tax=Limulus polyphemus TaxID=6850 RepID=A0ABM1B4S2_LIMPO|nr:tripartite motif-containing protein 45-like isoform X2 [Limulus polyphemus]
MSSHLPEEEQPQLTCGVCHRRYHDPRLLPCLHTFCTRCLSTLEPFESERDDVLKYSLNSFSRLMSHGASEYESKKSSFSSLLTLDRSSSQGSSLSRGVQVLCPSCNSIVDVTRDGVQGLTPNYLLRRKITKNEVQVTSKSTSCDMCTAVAEAVSYCQDCTVRLCSFCAEAHRRQKQSATHFLSTLEEAREKELFADYKKHICLLHKSSEVSSWCESCRQMVCDRCTIDNHRDHQINDLSKVYESKTQLLKKLMDYVVRRKIDIEEALENIQEVQKQLSDQIEQSREEVERFIAAYIRAVETHHQHLLQHIQRVEVGRQRVLRLQRLQLEQLFTDLNHWENFVQELLQDGDVPEVMGVYRPVQKRLFHLARLNPPLQPRVSPALSFLPQEQVGDVDGYLLYGVVSSQSACPSLCFIQDAGLKMIKAGCKTEITLFVRDSDDQPVIHNRTNIHVELRRLTTTFDSRESTLRKSQISLESSKPLVLYHMNIQGRERSNNRTTRHQDHVEVTTQKDGSHILSFTATQTGNFRLHVTVNGQDIKGSPFPVTIAPAGKRHTGVYHCCSFCSSGGSRDARCACGGVMPGGYQGCGHGHSGHPGHHHWSCCGNFAENSECSKRTTVYEYTV